jgi:ADP-ribosylglycohydrolase/protein-tyrosine phosphatase
MDRLRRFLVAGITCFVDLTEPDEVPSYEALLPFATPEGRRVEYLREPIRDHSVPSGHDVVARAIAMINDALGEGHVVYLHCRAGIGRSATVAGCWLAEHGPDGTDALDRLQECWQQSVRSRTWPVVPETEEQEAFVREWNDRRRSPVPVVAQPTPQSTADRIHGSLLGLALGDAAGAAARGGSAGEWTQHTALTLCLAESLLERGTCDARDQMERYLRWQRDGHGSAAGRPGRPTADVARALATYQWRGLPMAGSHDPRDRSSAALPRVVAAACHALVDPSAAVSLAAECARTTHQSPLVLDACRCYGALVVGALRGEPPGVLFGAAAYEPVAGLWTARPIKSEIVTALQARPAAPLHRPRAADDDVVHALVQLRLSLDGSGDPAQSMAAAVAAGREPALDGALAGALAGALWGASALPRDALAMLAGRDRIERVAGQLAARLAAGMPERRVPA